MSNTSEEQPVREQIERAIAENDVLLFMKGTPEQPYCGFSARTVAALESLGRPYAAVDVLPDPQIREELSAISEWPTIPQLFVDGKLVGGCDIVTEMYESGELATLLGVENPVSSEGDGVVEEKGLLGDDKPIVQEKGLLDIENKLEK